MPQTNPSIKRSAEHFQDESNKRDQNFPRPKNSLGSTSQTVANISNADTCTTGKYNDVNVHNPFDSNMNNNFMKYSSNVNPICSESSGSLKTVENSINVNQLVETLKHDNGLKHLPPSSMPHQINNPYHETSIKSESAIGFQYYGYKPEDHHDYFNRPPKVTDSIAG